jgi:hypothetical protein
MFLTKINQPDFIQVLIKAHVARSETRFTFHRGKVYFHIHCYGIGGWGPEWRKLLQISGLIVFKYGLPFRPVAECLSVLCRHGKMKITFTISRHCIQAIQPDVSNACVEKSPYQKFYQCLGFAGITKPFFSSQIVKTR